MSVNYISFHPFKFWCQKVLPLVYDDSLSYYELLCKLVEQLNVVMETTENAFNELVNDNSAFKEELKKDFSELTESFNVLKNYVDNYFNNLDVQEEINNKLDIMASDGTLDRIINTEIFGELNERIQTNTNNIENITSTLNTTVENVETNTKNIEENQEDITLLKERVTKNEENIATNTKNSVGMGLENRGIDSVMSNIIKLTNLKLPASTSGTKPNLTVCVVGDSTTAVYDVLPINHWTTIIKERLEKYFNLTFYNYALGNRNLGQFLSNDFYYPGTTYLWKDIVKNCNADIYIGMWGVNEAYNEPSCSQVYTINLINFYNTLKTSSNNVLLATPVSINVAPEPVTNKQQNVNISNISWVLRNRLFSLPCIDINAVTRAVTEGVNVYQVDIKNVYINQIPSGKFLNFNANFNLSSHVWYPFTSLSTYSTFMFRKYTQSGAGLDSYSRITFGLNDSGQHCCRFECADGAGNTFTSENYVISNDSLVNISIVGSHVTIDGHELNVAINVFEGYVNQLNCNDITYEIYEYTEHKISDTPLGFEYFDGVYPPIELLNGNGFTHPSINGQLILSEAFNKLVDFIMWNYKPA